MATGTIPHSDYQMLSNLLFTISLSDNTTHTVNSVNDRKISDYDYLLAVVGNHSRGTMILPTRIFATKAMYIGFMYAGSLKEVDVTYVSDTSVTITSVQINEGINVYGIKVVSV